MIYLVLDYFIKLPLFQNILAQLFSYYHITRNIAQQIPNKIDFI